MSEEIQEFDSGENDFLSHATRYTTETADESFINELAYVMVTLHQSNS
jgi:hypothetical protein